MKITDSVLRSFRVARTYRENSQKVNCVDYCPNGENAISSSDDDRIVLYDVREGRLVTLQPKHYIYNVCAGNVSCETNQIQVAASSVPGQTQTDPVQQEVWRRPHPLHARRHAHSDLQLQQTRRYTNNVLSTPCICV